MKKEIERLFYLAEKMKHACDKYRNYEFFKSELDKICGTSAGKDCQRSIYDEALKQISKILGV